MRTRSGSTMAWSLGVGWLGALAIGASGYLLTLMLDFLSGILDAVGHGGSGGDPTAHIWIVTGASMALCLTIACGGGWMLAGAPDGLTPRWLAGLGAGLLGVAAGVALFSIALGLTPI